MAHVRRTGRQARARIAPLVQVRDVVAVLPSVLLLDEGVQHALPVGREQQARQQRRMLGGVLARRLPAPFDEGIYSVPQRRGDDSLVLTRIPKAVVRNFA